MPNQKLRLKRILFLVLALATMAVIFFFSSQTGEKSGTVSSDVSTWIESSPNNVPSTGTSGDVSPWAGGFNLFSTETLNFISDHIRKIAHVFLYACLALFVTLFFSTFALPHKWLYILLPVGVCFLYACSDEIHQLFVDGRTGTFLDVLIDGIGFVTVTLLCNFLLHCIKKKK